MRSTLLYSPILSASASASSTGMPNLSQARPVVTWSWVSASTSGLTRSATRARLPKRAADAVEVLELGGGLDVEEQYALPEARHELLLGLADPGEDDLLRVEPGPHRPVELAAGDDVGPGPQRGQRPQHGEVPVRFDRVADQVIQARRTPRRAPCNALSRAP